MNDKIKAAEKWVTEYELQEKTYDTFRQEIERLVIGALRRDRIAVVSVDSRTKSPNSLSEKIIRKGKQYTDPLKEITDLAGLRVVAYFRKDISNICASIAQELDVNESESVDKESELNKDQFGYAARHLIVTLPNHRKQLTENQPYKDFCAEIQVRTALQDTWASIEHKLQYKGDRSLTDAASRSFYRLSAVLELADVEFERIRDASELESARLSVIEEGDLDIKLSLQSLDKYFVSSNVEDTYRQSALESGIVVTDTMERGRDLGKVLQTAGRLKIKVLTDLDKLINTDIEENVKLIKRVCNKIGFDPELSALELVALLLVTKSDSPETIGREVFESEFLSDLEKELK